MCFRRGRTDRREKTTSAARRANSLFGSDRKKKSAFGRDRTGFWDRARVSEKDLENSRCEGRRTRRGGSARVGASVRGALVQANLIPVEPQDLGSAGGVPPVVPFLLLGRAFRHRQRAVGDPSARRAEDAVARRVSAGAVEGGERARAERGIAAPRSGARHPGRRPRRAPGARRGEPARGCGARPAGGDAREHLHTRFPSPSPRQA